MSELSDKVWGCAVSAIGAGGVLSGISLVIDDPKKTIGYTGAIASAGCLHYGIKCFKKAYFGRTYNQDKE